MTSHFGSDHSLTSHDIDTADTVAAPFTGVWRLISFAVHDDTGGVLAVPMGPRPRGRLIYTEDGYMSATVGRRDAITSAPLPPGTGFGVEAVSAHREFLAYSGTYTWHADHVVHHVEIASIPEWNATQQVRRLRLRGDELTLTAPAAGPDGRVPASIWQRI
ncbi:lipocalin-like domain-containing protein [Nocardia sp. BMG51109]|uniref:lipocalin-like domain-containing protein n=1 Tax=Nocardia sp. BMG51109 TaxID=1056816 RepID=UPI0012EB7758|nr:lipocalin-like domain-containing protein [Nocardia sp. BMG51109]